MPSFKCTVISTLLASLALPHAFAQAKGIHQDVERLLPSMDEVTTINRVIELPIDRLVAIKADDQLLFVSDNGRYVFSGRAHDLWYDMALTDMASIDTSATTLSFERLDIDPATLNTLSIGAGNPESPITVFIDPLCEDCLRYIDTAQSLVDQYSFHFVLVPALGEASNQAAYHFACRDDSVSDTEALTALLDKRLGDLPAEPECDSDVYRSTLLLADMLKIDGVPYSVSAEGRVLRGTPGNLREWFGDNT